MKRVIGYIKGINKQVSYAILIVAITLIVSAILVFAGYGQTNRTVETNSENSSESQIISSEEISSDEQEISSEESSEQEVSSSDTEVTEPKKPVDYSPQNPPRERVAYLTFDDGPSENTLKILDILKSNGAVATFFVIGPGNLDYLPNIEEAGCKIGLHSASHNYSQIYSSVDAYFEDLENLQNMVESKVGHKTDIIRFPGGSSNTVSKNYRQGIMTELSGAVQEKGYRYFDWNVTSGDANSTPATADQIVNNVLSKADTCNSVCVLFHDSAPKRSTVEALPRIISGLKEMGYSFATLSGDCYGYHHAISN